MSEVVTARPAPPASAEAPAQRSTRRSAGTATSQAEEAAQDRAARKIRTGRVVSDKMEKTVVVQVSNLKSHRLYKKVMQHRVKFKAHDESNQCALGDLVRIMETRPISKDKRWRVVEIVEKAK